MTDFLRIIVGGQSEYDSIPRFIDRYCAFKNTHIDTEPYRTSEGKLKIREKLVNEISIVIRKYGAGPVLVLFDANDRICPKEFVEENVDAVNSEFPGIPVFIVIAKWETETWFVPAIESLRGVHEIPSDVTLCEDILSRLEELDPKSYISRLMGRKYKETYDQPAFMDAFDYTKVGEHSRSFRKFTDTLDELIALFTDPN
jgi:hypothetical protein